MVRRKIVNGTPYMLRLTSAQREISSIKFSADQIVSVSEDRTVMMLKRAKVVHMAGRQVIPEGATSVTYWMCSSNGGVYARFRDADMQYIGMGVAPKKMIPIEADSAD